MTSSVRQQRRIIDKSPQNDSKESASPSSSLTRWITTGIDVDGAEDEPATGAGGGIPGVTSSYSALTRATASLLRVNRNHMSSTNSSWRAIRNDLATPESGQWAMNRSAATAHFLSSREPVLRKMLNSKTPFRAEIWPNMTRSTTPVQKGLVDHRSTGYIFEMGKPRRCKRKAKIDEVWTTGNKTV